MNIQFRTLQDEVTSVYVTWKCNSRKYMYVILDGENIFHMCQM